MTPYHHHEQQKSKTIRHGPGKYHDKAQERMADMLENRGWNVYTDEPLHVRHEFHAGTKDYYHEYDIYAEKKHTNGLTSKLIVEVDGKKHDSPEQQKRDREAEHYAIFFIHDVRIIRMPIALLLNLAVSDDTIMKEYKLT